ncbi:hypothetical protein L1D41_00465 [Vibrio harveyi]|uniref:hypothetical protein n=1 Tax=Vibrio harveyi TaxID=669 RepID=UPI001EFDB290|nr:hypothetical protein [Vibrio harveyi]MCG9608149.1 hypothetical protein [Vibrio harveyi]MCG9666844.1 hypothetical protein [Vibrio harveyi]
MKVLDLVKAVIKTLIGFFVDVFAISVVVLFTFGLILEVLYFDAKLVFKKQHRRVWHSGDKQQE